MKYTLLIILNSFLITFISCQNDQLNISGGEGAITEVKRIASPDKKVEAVLIETNGGATVANGNKVFIVLPGRGIKGDDLRFAIFNADHCSELDIEWKQNRVLSVKYDKARIFNYTNFWHSDSLQNWNYVVEIKLDCISPNGQLNDRDRNPMGN